MTNLWSNSLPVELLQRILLYVKSELYLDDRDIFQCIQVFKRWKHTAQVIGYSRISLYKPSQIDSMERSMTNYIYPPGRYVKSVYYDIQPHHHYLPVLADLFPFVEHIDTSSLDASFYETLITLRRQFKLTQLKSFSPQYTYVSPIPFSQYAVCAVENSNTFTKFECRGRDSLEVTHEECFTDCFPHLQELSSIAVFCITSQQQAKQKSGARIPTTS